MTHEEFASMRAGFADFKALVEGSERGGMKMMGLAVPTGRHVVNYVAHLEGKGATDWKPFHSALSQCAELLDNMGDGVELTETPRFLAAKLEQTSRGASHCAQRTDNTECNSAAASVPAQQIGGSIDTPEFHALLLDYRAAPLPRMAQQAYESIIAHIDAHVATKVQAAREEAIDAAAARVEERRANISPVELCGEEVWEAANNVISNVAAAVLALKLPQADTALRSPAATDAGEQQ